MRSRGPRAVRSSRASSFGEPGDYGTLRGIRAADGHLRGVAFAIKRAIKGLQESAAPDSTPAPLNKARARVGR
jgi:hypothetical protein